MAVFTLEAWLAGLGAHCPHMGLPSFRELLSEHGDDLGVWARRDEGGAFRFGYGAPSDAWIVFAALARLGRFVPHRAPLAGLARTFDWKDPEGWGGLPAMMGLTFHDLRGGGWRLGSSEVADVVRRCNQIAAERGSDERLFRLRTDGDNEVVVRLLRSEARELVASGLVALDLDEPPPFHPEPAWRTHAQNLSRHADLTAPAGVALLALPVWLAFHDIVLAATPLFVAVLMLRTPLARRVSWLRWMRTGARHPPSAP